MIFIIPAVILIVYAICCMFDDSSFVSQSKDWWDEEPDYNNLMDMDKDPVNWQWCFWDEDDLP